MRVPLKTLLLGLFLSLVSTSSVSGIVGIALCQEEVAVTTEDVWTVAPHADGVRKVRYLKGGPKAGALIMTVPVGSPCFEDTRPDEDCSSPVNCTGESGDRRWRLWRKDGQSDGQAIGEVRCVLSSVSTITPPPKAPEVVILQWAVAVNGSYKTRPVYSKNVLGIRKIVARAAVGDSCGVMARENQTGKRQWRIWPASGEVIGEVYCEQVAK